MKCPKLFAWNEGFSLPRLNHMFRTMKECNSEKLYRLELPELNDDETFIGVIVGAKSREEAIDYICNTAKIDDDYMFQEKDERVKKGVKLWNDDFYKGYVDHDYL